MTDLPNPAEVLVLRNQVEALARLTRRLAKGRVRMPKLAGGARDEREAVHASDILTATLEAVASGTRRLQGDGIGLDLTSDPMELSFFGDLVGVSPTADRILIRVTPEAKKEPHGER